jgi:hypothetical protein
MNTSVKEYEEILAVINKYLEGCNKNSDVMKPAFHENAIVNAQPVKNLFDGVDEAGETQSVGRVDILDVVGDIACARVVLEGWHGMNFVDFHHLIKTEDGWKIVSKIYTQI